MLPMKLHQIYDLIKPCFNFRNRMLQSLILGLTFLSLYVSYYTITDRRYQLTISATRHPSPRSVARSILGTSKELPEQSSLMYTIEPGNLNAFSHASSEQSSSLNGETSIVRDTILELQDLGAVNDTILKQRILDGSSNNIIKQQRITNEKASSAEHLISKPQLNIVTLNNTIKPPIVSNGETSSVEQKIVKRRILEASNRRREHRPTSTLSKRSRSDLPSEPTVSKSSESHLPSSLAVSENNESHLPTSPAVSKGGESRLPSSPGISKSIEQPIARDAQKIGAVVASANHNKLISDIYQAGHSVLIPEKCPDFGAGLELLILIMSAPSHAKARTAIRLTWGAFGQRKDVSIAFLLGNTTDSRIEDELLDEQNMYGDIIRGNSPDSYSYLTLKAISALEWVCDYCSRVKFVLKTDDDMFINVPRLLSFINNHSNDTNVIYGRLAKGWLPFRDSKNKYYVPLAQYEPKIFPDFTTGPAYLLSRDVIPKLYKESLKQGFMRLEDVFVTGIVGSKLGIKRTQADEFKNERISFNPCTVERTLSIHMVKYREQFHLWKMLLDGESKCNYLINN